MQIIFSGVSRAGRVSCAALCACFLLASSSNAAQKPTRNYLCCSRLAAHGCSTRVGTSTAEHHVMWRKVQQVKVRTAGNEKDGLSREPAHKKTFRGDLCRSLVSSKFRRVFQRDPALALFEYDLQLPVRNICRVSRGS